MRKSASQINAIGDSFISLISFGLTLSRREFNVERNSPKVGGRSSVLENASRVFSRRCAV